MDPRLYYTLKKLQRNEAPPTTAVKSLRVVEGAIFDDARIKQTVLGFSEPPVIPASIGWDPEYRQGGDRPVYVLMFDSGA